MKKQQLRNLAIDQAICKGIDATKFSRFIDDSNSISDILESNIPPSAALACDILVALFKTIHTGTVIMQNNSQPIKFNSPLNN
jgi:hypothetical protein